MTEDHSNADDKKREEQIKQLSRVVCICKGIPLSKFLPILKDCETVADVNALTGSGSGNCRGERCGPRIKTLLKKSRDSKNS